MLLGNSITTIALATALLAGAGARADDAAKYPNLKGQWGGVGATPDAPWDPSKPAGAGQQAPLTPEYQGIYQAILASHAGGAKEPTNCLPPGMPRTMLMYEPMEIIVMPDTTYLMITYMSEFRRIFTDGRKWPQDIEPSYAGYSIGTWIDEGKDGHYNVLEVETRALKGPRSLDASGLPLHQDAQTIVKERFYLDKASPDTLHDQITVYDHALTHPWTVLKTMRREPNPIWVESVCAENNLQVNIGNEHYMLNNLGELMPAKKDQPPPDLKHFNQPKK